MLTVFYDRGASFSGLSLRGENCTVTVESDYNNNWDVIVRDESGQRTCFHFDNPWGTMEYTEGRKHKYEPAGLRKTQVIILPSREAREEK